MGNRKTQNRLRYAATLGLLFAYGVLLIAISAIESTMGPMIQPEGLFPILVLLFSTPIFASAISMVWRYQLVLLEEGQEKEANSLEKRKRDRIDSVLRDLSSEDLKRLKQRLSDGTLDDEMLYDEIVGDDGKTYRELQSQ